MNSPLKQTVENKTDKEEKSKGKQKLRFFVCEALSVPGAATATGPVSGTGMIDLYKICLTRSLSPFCSLSILLAGFGVYLRGNMCLWLHIHVCTEEVVSTSADASSKSSQLHKPKVRCLLFLPLGTCGSPPTPASQIHSRMHHLLSLLFLSFLSILLFLMLAASVPVLVFVVPAVEVYVERHDAAGRHASDQSPEGAESYVCKIELFTFFIHCIFPWDIV